VGPLDIIISPDLYYWGCVYLNLSGFTLLATNAADLKAIKQT
jgi:hypothetical protein